MVLVVKDYRNLYYNFYRLFHIQYFKTFNERYEIQFVFSYFCV
jgi:hypothetical protein